MIVNNGNGESYKIFTDNDELSKGFIKYDVNKDQYLLLVMKKNGERLTFNLPVFNNEKIIEEIEKIVATI